MKTKPFLYPVILLSILAMITSLLALLHFINRVVAISSITILLASCHIILAIEFYKIKKILSACFLIMAIPIVLIGLI